MSIEIDPMLLASGTATPIASSPSGFLPQCTALNLGGGQGKALNVTQKNLPFPKVVSEFEVYRILHWHQRIQDILIKSKSSMLAYDYSF